MTLTLGWKTPACLITSSNTSPTPAEKISRGTDNWWRWSKNCWYPSLTNIIRSSALVISSPTTTHTLVSFIKGLVHPKMKIRLFYSPWKHSRCMWLSLDVRCSERKVFIMFEIWISIFQKRMDSLKGAFIHPPEPCEGYFITDAHTLFHIFRTRSSKYPFIPIERLGGTRTMFYVTPIGFFWKKKATYT